MSGPRPYVLDHVVVFVADLGAAVESYRALGFSVVPGGVHADGTTHNALIPFPDGTYLELLAFRRPLAARVVALPGGERLASWLVRSSLLRRRLRRIRHGEGLVDFALACASPGEAALPPGGVARWRGPEPGGRVRPDGISLAWEVAFPSDPALPFVISDRTPRSLRIPPAVPHPNGATGMRTVTVATAVFDRTVGAYAELLGREPFETIAPVPRTVAAEFRLGSARIRVVAPRGRDHPLREELARRGGGPIGVVLEADGPRAVNLDVRLARGASLTLAPRS